MQIYKYVVAKNMIIITYKQIFVPLSMCKLYLAYNI